MKFYLQKTGNPLLQPLESANIKVHADHYRILAQSSLKKGQGIDIIVNYHHPIHPQRYQYHQQVNDEGNVIIMPPTQLHPGQWEIHCCSDLISELVGEYWQTSLYFQIEAQPDLSSQIMPHQSDDLQSLEEKIQPNLETLKDKLSPLNSISLTPNLPETTVNLILETKEITRQWGDSIAIAGQIEIENTIEEIDCLQYQIIDPITQDCLYQQKQPLTVQSSFLAFQHSLTLPETIKNSTVELIAQVLTITGESCDRQTLTIYTEMPETVEEINEYLQYTLELSDIESQVCYTFDIAIEKPANTLPIMVHLPNPQKRMKPLRQIQQSCQSSLPPRLFNDKATSRRLPLQLPKITRDVIN